MWHDFRSDLRTLLKADQYQSKSLPSQNYFCLESDTQDVDARVAYSHLSGVVRAPDDSPIGIRG